MSVCAELSIILSSDVSYTSLSSTALLLGTNWPSNDSHTPEEYWAIKM